MTAQDLIVIGRLGGQDADGWFKAMIKPGYRRDFDELDKLYLIFEENRVFYLSISERKESGRDCWLMFAEDGVSQERKLHREAYIAIDAEEIETDEDSGELLGSDVVWQDSILGCVVDVFDNGAHEVLVVNTALDIEIMIPFVEHYVRPCKAGEPLILSNMTELLSASELSFSDGVLYEEDADA